jgi:hypothetical protein
MPSLLQKARRTSAPPRRPSPCPPRQMDEHLPGVSMRRDARSCPMVEYRQTARRTAEYMLVGGGTTECRQPAGGLARGGAGGDRATRGERGFATRKWGSRVLSPTERACPRFSLIWSPRAHPGSQGLPGLSGWIKALFRGKRGTGGAAGLNYAVRMEKRASGGLIGETAGDALSFAWSRWKVCPGYTLGCHVNSKCRHRAATFQHHDQLAMGRKPSFGHPLRS